MPKKHHLRKNSSQCIESTEVVERKDLERLLQLENAQLKCAILRDRTIGKIQHQSMEMRQKQRLKASLGQPLSEAFRKFVLTYEEFYTKYETLEQFNARNRQQADSFIATYVRDILKERSPATLEPEFIRDMVIFIFNVLKKERPECITYLSTNANEIFHGIEIVAIKILALVEGMGRGMQLSDERINEEKSAYLNAIRLACRAAAEKNGQTTAAHGFFRSAAVVAGGGATSTPPRDDNHSPDTIPGVVSQNSIDDAGSPPKPRK